jgi:hypothetical protein
MARWRVLAKRAAPSIKNKAEAAYRRGDLLENGES